MLLEMSSDIRHFHKSGGPPGQFGMPSAPSACCGVVGDQSTCKGWTLPGITVYPFTRRTGKPLPPSPIVLYRFRSRNLFGQAPNKACPQQVFLHIYILFPCFCRMKWTAFSACDAADMIIRLSSFRACSHPRQYAAELSVDATEAIPSVFKIAILPISAMSSSLL